MFPGINIRSRINNFTSFQFFQFFRIAILLLVDIIFVKVGFGMHNIGMYVAFLMIAGSISFFWINGMLQSFLSIYSNNKSFTDSQNSPLVFNVALLMFLVGILVASIFYLFSDKIFSLLSLSNNGFEYIHLLILYVIISAPVNIVEYFYLLKNKTRSLILYTIFTYIAQLLCLTIPAIAGWGLSAVFIGLISINLFRLFWLVGIVIRYSQIKISYKFIKEYLFLAAPLVISFFLSGCDQYIDGYIIASYLDPDALAVYRYGAKEIPFLIVPINAFCAVYIVKLSQSTNIGLTLSEIKLKGRKMLTYIFPLSIFFVLSSKFLFPFVFSKDFSESAIIFNIYALLIVIRFAFARLVLLGLKDTKPLMVSSFLEIIINISLSLVFIKIWGIIGVAVASVIAYYSDVFFLVSYLKFFKKIRISSILDIKALLFFSAILYLAFFLTLIF